MRKETNQLESSLPAFNGTIPLSYNSHGARTHTHINNSTLLQEIHAASLESTKPIPYQLGNWWQWYQHLTGLDVVQTAKHRVNQVQDILFKCQEERRKLTREVAHINKSLRDIYEELVQTWREDPKYMDLTILDNKHLKAKLAISSHLVLLENEERDLITQLAIAIKDYQVLDKKDYKCTKI
ncbi:uncharacterized protein LOC107270691 isoform X2 [Cephus cinctus]|uniref:Uncharacterized protein LOC107270691 isoform X2 n=1 Tax=Cephus cinctus TaxID=211228 RepID=A0AAJ7W460_CEPCN|nr:uncharacterized protein LOC107270691 isoform X2 [Cephus cinctus]